MTAYSEGYQYLYNMSFYYDPHKIGQLYPRIEGFDQKWFTAEGMEALTPAEEWVYSGVLFYRAMPLDDYSGYGDVWYWSKAGRTEIG